MAVMLNFGRQICGDLEQASAREWLVTDGLGGYAMGTISGLRTRRYHGLLTVASEQASKRNLALAALDPTLVIGTRRIRLATCEWSGPTINPAGHIALASFQITDGIPTWDYCIDDIALRVEVAMSHGACAVEVSYHLLRAPDKVGLELSPLCTWRDANGSRRAYASPHVVPTTDGFVFEDSYRVAGPSYSAQNASWYYGVHYRVEAARGLDCDEDLWCAGTFRADLQPGETTSVRAWSSPFDQTPPPGLGVKAKARRRELCAQAGSSSDVGEILVGAADQFVIEGPDVVAGYPWFGPWSRDTMTSYEGLFLCTQRFDEGSKLLQRACGSISKGMLVNTGYGDTAGYNTVDAALWLLHAASRHLDVTGDVDLANELADSLLGIADSYFTGTRYGIGVDPADGLLRAGEPGIALTWMDARINGVPVTPRFGKPVEINALYVSGLAGLARILRATKRDAHTIEQRCEAARKSMAVRFVRPDNAGLFDVVDAWPPSLGSEEQASSHGDLINNSQIRPNQILGVSLPDVGLDPSNVLVAIAPLVTSLGLRSLTPTDPDYLPVHRGNQVQRDLAYHQGTVWPWLIGPYVEAATRAGIETTDVLTGLEAHLGDWGLGSISETADGDAPHGATGCPFQAWSVAEVLRARKILAERPWPRRNSHSTSTPGITTTIDLDDIPGPTTKSKT